MSTTIALSKGTSAVIDDDDVWIVVPYTWCVSSEGYAMTSAPITRRTIYMHRLILGLEAGEFTDHINGDRLDNRRENLRQATVGQNTANTGLTTRNRSGFKGVYFHRRTGKWIAQIKVAGRKKHLGTFSAAKDAARAYDEAARNAFGHFAWLNFPASAQATQPDRRTA